MTAQREIIALLREAMGFDAAALSESAVVRAVRKRMLQCGQASDHAYLVYLRASALEMAQLVEEMVVPETWFFRDGKPFEWLRRHVQEEWQPANPKRPMRLLSVPCSSGEEPYSMVMALLDAGLPPERIGVDAVDISQVALGKARRGLYGKHSFRNAPAGLQERHFTRSPQGWLLHDEVRQPVHFAQANLLAADFALNRPPYDVIFCRNLLIYFDEPNRERALSTLDKLLTPQGILFVGHAENAPVLDRWFASIAVPQTFAYRKKSGALPAAPRARAAAPRWVGTQALAMPRQPAPPRSLPQQAATAAPTSPADRLAQAQRLADQGRLAEAAVLCEAVLREHGPSADAYYLLGLVHEAGRDSDNARDFFGKAIYLRPDHYEAMVNLALLADKRGEAQDAARWRQRAERVAGRRSDK